MMKAVIVLTTMSTLDDAQRISKLLVEEKVAACCTIVPKILSIYRWKGTIENAEEFMILIKTRRSQVSRLMSRLKQIHPYEVPEMLVVDVPRGSPPYLKWIAESTA